MRARAVLGVLALGATACGGAETAPGEEGSGVGSGDELEGDPGSARGEGGGASGAGWDFGDPGGGEGAGAGGDPGGEVSDGGAGGRGGGGSAGPGEGGGDAGQPASTTRLTGLRPSEGDFDGGEEVTISGDGLAAATQVKFGGGVAIILDRAARALVVEAPPGQPGGVEVTVQVGERVLRAGRRFHYRGPRVDGNVGEWPGGAWDPTRQEARSLEGEEGLVRMAAVSDGRTLTVALIGLVDQHSAIVGYVDLDPGAGTGVTRMQDIDPSGDPLAQALSNPLTAQGGFGAELAFGTVGMWSSREEADPRAGWRDVSDPADVRWVGGALHALVAVSTVEASIPLPRGLAGGSVAVVIRIVSVDGRRLAPFTLPPDDDAQPGRWTRSYLVPVPDP